MTTALLEKELVKESSYKNSFVVKIIKPNVTTKDLLESRVISASDNEMDRRAQLAVMAAVAKAKACNKPVAKYDTVIGKAYLEYCDGTRKYIG